MDLTDMLQTVILAPNEQRELVHGHHSVGSCSPWQVSLPHNRRVPFSKETLWRLGSTASTTLEFRNLGLGFEVAKLSFEQKVQEDFVEVTHDYPDAWHSMDLVAEHRLRMLHTSGAYAKWQIVQKTQPHPSSKLSIKIEQVLEVSLPSIYALACICKLHTLLQTPLVLKRAVKTFAHMAGRPSW